MAQHCNTDLTEVKACEGGNKKGQPPCRMATPFKEF